MKKVPYTIVCPSIIIKSGTKIHGQSVIEYAEIGNNCEIFNFSLVGKCPQDLKYHGEKTKVVVGDGTTVREFVTLNGGPKKTGKTLIGKNCYFMMSSHIAHDYRIGDSVIMANCSAAGGRAHVEIGDEAFISGYVGVQQFTKIGKGTMRRYYGYNSLRFMCRIIECC